MGFIYVMSNVSMPDLLKIGFTEDLNQRLKQANASSFVPTPFIIEISKHVSNPREKERIIHKILDSKRNKSNREFFRITLEEIKPIFELIDYYNKLYSEEYLKEIKITHQKHVRQIFESMKMGERKIYEMYTQVKEELNDLRFNVHRNNEIQDFIDNKFISSTNIMNYDILIEYFKEWYSNDFDSDDSPPYKIFLYYLSRKYGKSNENGFYIDIKI